MLKSVSRKIILASGSPRREELLHMIGLKFRVAKSGFDETSVIGWPPDAHVIQSATGKAEDVSLNVPDGIIIGADTIVVVENHILGKPSNPEDARRMLRLLSGRTHYVYTGLCVIERAADKEVRRLSGYEKTAVHFAAISNDTIAQYVDTGECMDKAGAYGIQGRGSVLIEGITGDYFNVVGLPLHYLSNVLLTLGVPLFDRCNK